MNEQEKQFWRQYYSNIGYDPEQIEALINAKDKFRAEYNEQAKPQPVIRQARPTWEKGNTISVEEKRKRDKQQKAMEDTKRSIVRDLAVGMGTNDPKAQEAVASFNAQHVYAPNAALEWGFPLSTLLGMGTGHMLGSILEDYGEKAATAGGLIGSIVGGSLDNPTQIMRAFKRPKAKVKVQPKRTTSSVGIEAAEQTTPQILRDPQGNPKPNQDPNLVKQAQFVRSEALQGLYIVKKFITSHYYKDRLKAHFPFESEEAINDRIMWLKTQLTNAEGHINTDYSWQELTSPRMKSLGFRTNGYVHFEWLPIAEHNGQKLYTAVPTELRIAYDSRNPRETTIHELMHWLSAGGYKKNVAGKSEFDIPMISQEIRDFDATLLPTLDKEGDYKDWLNAVDKDAFKKDFIARKRKETPGLSTKEYEKLYDKMIEDGQYFNTEDEIRSFMFEFLLSAWDRGLIKNPNDDVAIQWYLFNHFKPEKSTNPQPYMPQGIEHIIKDYRNKFDKWGKYMSEALSLIGISRLLSDQEEKEDKNKKGVPKGKNGLKVESLIDEFYNTQYIRQIDPTADKEGYKMFVQDILTKLTPDDYIKAQNMGISEEGLIKGSWYGGLSMVRDTLNRKSFVLIPYMK